MSNFTEKPVQRVAIIGAGVMGGGIAKVFAASGAHVILYDVKAEAVSTALAHISKRLSAGVERGKLDAGEAAETLARIKPSTSITDFKNAQLVIEAIVEDVEIKHHVFAEVEAHVGADCILVSNTSSLSINELSRGVQNPARFAGLHFFNPAPVMRLVEIVRGVNSDAAVIKTLASWVKAVGKTPVIVEDSPGFVVNRCARPFYGEALAMLSEGVATSEDIDACLETCGGFPMGPFRLIDLIGLDVNLAATEGVWEAFGKPTRFAPSECIRKHVSAGRLGRKTGKGFYTYNDYIGDVDRSPLAPLATIVTDVAKSVGVTARRTDGRCLKELGATEPTLLYDLTFSHTRPVENTIAITHAGLKPTVWDEVFLRAKDAGVTLVAAPDTPGLIMGRMAAALIGEARLTAADGVAKPADIDTAMTLGLNFARGPFDMATKMGEDMVGQVLSALAAGVNGERYQDYLATLKGTSSEG